MKILVTGTAGFIGFHLAKRLLERGDIVVGIDNIPTLPLTPARLHRSGGPKREILSNPDAIGIRAMGENLARASVGMWGEGLNFLDSFVYFSHQGEK
jgi:nucleoside-diphosphate-sugar epimerase